MKAHENEIGKHAKQNPKLGTQNHKTHDAKPKTPDPEPETLLLAGPDFFSVSRFGFPVPKSRRTLGQPKLPGNFGAPFSDRRKGAA